jgi:dihydrofolate reductase
MSMSLDGFIAAPDDTVPYIFDWYTNGDVVTENAKPDLTFRTTPQSAEHIREGKAGIRNMIFGRRTFDITDGWGGQHPFDVPIFVVTHTIPTDWKWIDTAPFTFVTSGVKDAVEQAKAQAGEGIVGVGGASITQQCLELGLLDEIRVNLTPVLLGTGIRWLDVTKTIEFEDPKVIEGRQVVHLYYRVKR